MLFNLFVARLCGANILEASLEVRASHLVHAADKFFSTMTDMVEHMSIMAKWGGYLHDPEILVLCSDAVRELPNAEQESFLKTLAHVVGSKDEKPTRDELVQLLLTIKLGVKGLN